MKVEAPRGTHDVLASDWPHWERIVDEVGRLCALYGYRPITTPVFEDTELFQRTSGAGSDVVQKEMYTFLDRSGRSLTLRPEGTAPIARAYLQHGLQREPQPAKLFTIAPMHRYSAPQRGRYREHWQLSVEAIGSADPAVDAEIVQLYAELLRALGVSEWTLLLNSIGDAKCRPAYLERLTAWLDEHDADLRDEEVSEKRATSPLRIFDVKSEAAQRVLADAPKIGESLCPECEEHFAGVRTSLDAYGVAYELAPTLVRGLDYYTRTTWEFVGPHEGAQSSLSGGGRYDGLVEEIGGPPTPGVGFGAGIERLHMAIAAEPKPAEIDVFLACEDQARRLELLPLLAELRAAGRSAETDYAGRSLKGQLTQAQRLGARTIVIAGGKEATIRRRGGRPDVSVPFSQLRQELREQ
ncbi:MAG TPA: histidine--tRNA ligase [Gaiellaceae bacterium]|nr:histidine--tRNA ligase [Gaiellaceae bacterium]